MKESRIPRNERLIVSKEKESIDSSKTKTGIFVPLECQAVLEKFKIIAGSDDLKKGPYTIGHCVWIQRNTAMDLRDGSGDYIISEHQIFYTTEV